MSTQLPKGWVEISFTSVFDINGGTQPPKSDFVYEPKEGYIRLLQIRDFGDKPVPTYIPFEKKLRICEKDDILIARYGASIGRILTGQEGAYNVAIAKVDIPNPISNRYIFWLLNSSIFQTPVTSYQRTAQSGFNKSDLAQINIPLAPLAEQKRIADKLDALYGHMDKVKAGLERVPGLLKKFRQQVLTQAVTGKLTEDWREVNEVELDDSLSEGVESPFDIPDNWKFVPLSKLADKFSYGTSKKSDELGLVPVLRMGNMQNGKIDWSDLKYTSDESEIEKYSLSKGDVIFNRTNSPELVGKTSIYEGEQDAIYAGYLIKIWNTSALNSYYLNYVLNSPYARDWCWKIKTDGVSQSNINAKKLASFLMPYTSPEEQKEIVKRVDALFAVADAIEKQYNTLQQKAAALPQAILSKAFRGELVPQNPNDEPAAELLKRIGTMKK